jgi:hypothetical protein
MQTHPTTLAAVAALLFPMTTQAAVTINTQNTTVPNQWKLGINVSGAYDTADQDANKVGGDFTGGSPNDTFTVSVRPWTGFVQADAVTAISGGTFNTYVNGLTAGTIGRLAGGGFGVNGSTVDGEDQALSFTFGSFSLAGTSQVKFNGFNVGLYTANDRADLFYWNSSTNTVTQLLNVAGNAPGVAIIAGFDFENMNSGDMIVIAGSAASQNFRVDSVGFDIIPEPSSFALLGVGLGVLFLRRRRS